MWLIYLVAVVVALCLIGALAFGFGFTLIAVPILILAGLAGVLYRFLARTVQERKQVEEGGGPVPLSTEANEETSHEPRTPSELVDARRVTQ